MAGLISLTRPANSLALGLLYFGLAQPFGAALQLATTLLALAWVTAAAAGYVWNDIADIEIDRTVHPDRALASGVVTIRAASLLTGILSAAAVALAVLAGTITAWFILVSLPLAFLYSSVLRRRSSLAANVLCALLVTAVPSSAFPESGWVAWLVGMVAFILTLTREVVKDILEESGDRLLRPAPILGRLSGARRIFFGRLLVFALVVSGTILAFSVGTSVGSVLYLSVCIAAVAALGVLNPLGRIDAGRSTRLKLAAYLLTVAVLAS